MIAFVSRCPKLSSVDLAGTLFDDEGLAVLAKTHRHQLTAIDVGNTKITDKGRVHFLGHYCPNLHSLLMTRAKTTDKGVSFIARGCPDLILLDISHNAHILNRRLAGVPSGYLP